MKQPCPITAGHFERLCLSLWLIQDSNWKGRVLWKLFGGLATILQNWISCNEQKMREAHITRRRTDFYLLIFIEKIINRKIEHSQNKNSLPSKCCKNTQAYPYSGSKRNRLMKQAVTGHSCRDNTAALP